MTRCSASRVPNCPNSVYKTAAHPPTPERTGADQYPPPHAICGFDSGKRVSMQSFIGYTPVNRFTSGANTLLLVHMDVYL